MSDATQIDEHILRSNGVVDADECSGHRSRVAGHALKDRSLRLEGSITNSCTTRMLPPGYCEAFEMVSDTRIVLSMVSWRCTTPCHCAAVYPGATNLHVIVNHFVDDLPNKSRSRCPNTLPGRFGCLQQTAPVGNCRGKDLTALPARSI